MNLAARSELEGSRLRIHAAALRLFARFGYEGVSLQMIADQVGLHKSSLFHHYRSKLELALEVFADVLARVLECLQPLAADPESNVDTFLGCTDALVDHFSDDPDGARLLMTFIMAPEGSELRVQDSSPCDDRQRQLFGLLFVWLERARRVGAIRALNVRQTIFNLMGLVLFYPATATDLALGQVAGPAAFSPAARRVRKHELRVAVRGLLANIG